MRSPRSIRCVQVREPHMTMQANRRDVLKTGAAALLGAMSQPFTAIPALADYAVGPTVRRNAFTMAENDPILRGYRRAITAMRALPTNNPCSWTYQATIHGTTMTPVLTAWNTCHTDPTFLLVVAPDVSLLVRAHRPEVFRDV